MIRSALMALLLSTPLVANAAHVFSVAEYGAKGDGKTLDTRALQHAIDAAAAAGGGTVNLPTGTYLSGSLFVKNGVTLEIQSGATILGSQRLADYPVMPTRIAGIEMSWPAALVNVYDQHDATITGAGTIDGDGKIFWDSYWSLRKQYEPRGLRWASDYDAQRPRLIQIFNADHVSLSKLLLRRSGFWTVHICYSHDIAVDGITIRNNEDGHGPSTDGIDIDSSRSVQVSHADIAVNDDALCLKAGRDSDGLRVNRPTEDVVLRDSIVRAGAAGVTFGSETSGGFRNIEASGITVLSPVPVGILFKSAHTRGGFGENLRLHDFDLHDVQVALRITMNWNPSYSYASIPADAKDYPPYWKVLATPVPADQGMAHLRNVEIAKIAGTAKTAFEVDAYPRVPLRDFTLNNLSLKVSTAGHIADASHWAFSAVDLHIADGSNVTLKDDTDITGLPQQQAAATQTTTPAPTPAMQAIIDKDNSRHFGDSPEDPGPLATNLSPAMKPAAIDAAVRKVADWQLARSQPYFDRIWTWSVLYTGFLAASDSLDDPRYRDAMLAMSKGFEWQLRNRLPNADDQSVGSTYLELYLREPKDNANASWMVPTRTDLDTILPLKTLREGDDRIPWWWCDALFMAPAVWAEMSRATGDPKYVAYLDTQWKQTSDLLYDPVEHLYARDATYKDKREPNGKKVFWSRGEGWVMGGLARTLDQLPANDPQRPFYVQQLREMAARVAQLQDANGLWHAALLDPEHFPAPEISGSALFTYAMAWGINRGILDRATYQPVVTRAWQGMLQHIYTDGRLGDIQQTGAEPAYYRPSASYTYGVGAFLLAGSEVKRMVQPPSAHRGSAEHRGAASSSHN